MLIAQIFINISCSYLASSNSLNNSCRACSTVTTGKNTISIFYLASHSCGNCPSLQADTSILKGLAVNALTDGHHNNITWYPQQWYLSVNRPCSAPGINRADNLWLYPESYYPAIFICLNMMWRLQAIQLCSLSNSTLNFLWQGCHILLTASIGNTYLPSSQTDSRTSTVHSHITATNNHYILALEIRHIIVTNALQQLYSGDNPLGILPFNADFLIVMSTNGNINCIVFIVEAFQSNFSLFLTNSGIQMHLYSGAKNYLQILIQTLTREAIIWNTIAQHTAQLLLLLKDNSMMAH